LNHREGQARASRIATRRVTDETREVTDQEDDLVPELLELAHLVDEHRVPKMQIGRSRIEPRLDAQRLAALELLDQFGFDEQLGGAASDLVQLFCCARHSSARVDPALRRE